MLSSDERAVDVSLDHLPANSLPNDSVISAILIAELVLDRRHCSFDFSTSTLFMVFVLSLYGKKQ